MFPAVGDGEPEEAAFAGEAAVLVAVPLLVYVRLVAVEARWLADLPAEGAANGFAPAAADGCPAGPFDLAEWYAGEVL